MKISQLSQELTSKNEYLEKSEAKIVSLKSDLNDSRQQIKDLTSEVSKLKESLQFFKDREANLAQQLSDINHHTNFLQLENSMLIQQRDKLLSHCPSSTTDLSTIKMIPKPYLKHLLQSHKAHQRLIKSQRILERKTMLLNDPFTHSQYLSNPKNSQPPAPLTPRPNSISTKDLHSENQNLTNRIKSLEDLCQGEIQKREEMETERNKLRKVQQSQAKDLEKLRKQLAHAKKQLEVSGYQGILV